MINPEGMITHRFAKQGYKVRPAVDAVHQSLLTELEPSRDAEAKPESKSTQNANDDK